MREHSHWLHQCCCSSFARGPFTYACPAGCLSFASSSAGCPNSCGCHDACTSFASSTANCPNTSGGPAFYPFWASSPDICPSFARATTGASTCCTSSSLTHASPEVSATGLSSVNFRNRGGSAQRTRSRLGSTSQGFRAGSRFHCITPEGNRTSQPTGESTPPLLVLHTDDLYNWRRENDRFSDNPRELTGVLDAIFFTHQPTWDGCQQLLKIHFCNCGKGRHHHGGPEASSGS